MKDVMKKYRYYITGGIFICILIFILNLKTGWKAYEHSSGYYSDETYLHGGIDIFELDKRITYRVRCEVSLKSGKVMKELYDSTYDIDAFGKPDEQQIVAKMEMEESGTYYMDLPITDSGTYYLAGYAAEGSQASVDTYVEVRQYIWQILWNRMWKWILNDGAAYRPF
ncbi:MAG: hypothetical protein NC412_00490 [Roseburia sp.]|nr:hypothetical protein [Roseburia sp.]MCM1278595.1 hypothetical protein [Robinsoniella sp.]